MLLVESKLGVALWLLEGPLVMFVSSFLFLRHVFRVAWWVAGLLLLSYRLSIFTLLSLFLL